MCFLRHAKGKTDDATEEAAMDFCVEIIGAPSFRQKEKKWNTKSSPSSRTLSSTLFQNRQAVVCVAPPFLSNTFSQQSGFLRVVGFGLLPAFIDLRLLLSGILERQTITKIILMYGEKYLLCVESRVL